MSREVVAESAAESMFHNPSAQTPYYRVIPRGVKVSHVLSGMGSYYTVGGRYHRPQQRTVYAADDPLVSVSEMAFYQALEWQERIGGGRTIAPNRLPKPAPPRYPLVSSHFIWCFTLDSSPTVIDIDDPAAYLAFQHEPIEILNPGRAYSNTQDLADRVRAYSTARHPRPQGIRAPSVRTPGTSGYQPSQYAFFVMNGGKLKGRVLWKADLTLEFLDQSGNAVNPRTRDVAWTHPRFQVNGLKAAIPVFNARPASESIHDGVWYAADMRMT